MSETEEAIQSVLILMSKDFGSKMNICYSMILYIVYYLIYYKYKYRLNIYILQINNINITLIKYTNTWTDILKRSNTNGEYACF